MPWASLPGRCQLCPSFALRLETSMSSSLTGRRPQVSTRACSAAPMLTATSYTRAVRISRRYPSRVKRQGWAAQPVGPCKHTSKGKRHFLPTWNATAGWLVCSPLGFASCLGVEVLLCKLRLWCSKLAPAGSKLTSSAKEEECQAAGNSTSNLQQGQQTSGPLQRLKSVTKRRSCMHLFLQVTSPALVPGHNCCS